MTFPEERATITNLLKRFPDPVVIVDLGAHEGEDTAWMLEVLGSTQRTSFPMAVMVEADPFNFEILKTNYPRQMDAVTGFSFSTNIVIHGAIASYDGTCQFNANRSSGGGFGSIYTPCPERLSVDHAQWTKVKSVPCFTFDTLFHKYLPDHIDLLWVDIHGAEKDMIIHGQEALKRTRYLFMEAVDVRMYEGAATSSELQTMLPGWTIMQVFPWNLLLRNERYCETL